MKIKNMKWKILFIFSFIITSGVFMGVSCGDSLFLSNEDVIYENWQVRLPEGGKEIYYKSSEASFHGDGQRYSVYEYDNKDIISNAFDWQDKKDENMEKEINEIFERLKEDMKTSEEYNIDFNKKYKYIRKIEYDNSHLYLIYIIDENRIYVIEDIY